METAINQGSHISAFQASGKEIKYATSTREGLTVMFNRGTPDCINDGEILKIRPCIARHTGQKYVSINTIYLLNLF